MAISKTLSRKITENNKITSQTKKIDIATVQEKHPITEANTIPRARQNHPAAAFIPENSNIGNHNPLHDKPISRDEQND